MARKPWWHTTLEKMAQNPITTPKRKTNRDIYNEELRKLEKLAEKAQKAGIQVSYTPSKAKRIRQENIKGIQAKSISLKREIRKAQRKQRRESPEWQAKQEEKKRKTAQRKREQRNKALEQAEEMRKLAQTIEEVREKFPPQEPEQLAEPEVFAWGDLADFRFHYILSEIDSAIDVLQRSKRYSEYPVEELRDLLVEWYQDDPAEMLSELFATDTMQQLQTKDQLYSAVETGEIYALMERLTSEHDRLRQIHVVEDFGLLED